MSKTQHQVLAIKWRPKHFGSVIGQEHAVQALSNALNQNMLHHAYLFTGTRGVGKTTIARILAKCLTCTTGITATPCGECEHCQEIDAGRFPDLFEIDAASRTKVEDTRELLDNVQYSPVKGRFKIYLIDEVHMLSGHSFNALLKTLEEPPEHVKFLLATTDPQKLPATVLSRCLQFHLTHMPPEQISSHLENILQQESIEGEKPALELIAQAAQGSMRDALSLLDQSIAFGNQQVKTDDVKKMLGTVDNNTLIQILSALAKQDANALLAGSAKLTLQGADFKAALADLLRLLHQITLIQVTPSTNNNAILTDLAGSLSPEDVQLFYQIGLLGQRDLSASPSPQIGFEMTLLRMLTFVPQPLSNSHKTHKSQPQSTATSDALTAVPHANADSSEQWLNLIASLKVPGSTKALLRACAMESLADDHITLSLMPTHEALLSDSQVTRISQALSEYFNKPFQVNIEVKKSQQPTAQSTLDDKKTRKQQQAQDTLLQDANVKKILTTFDATVIKDSIAAQE